MRFLLYDEITKMEKGRSVIGTKTFSISDECFRGHFRREAVVPGVLFIEAMAQVLGWLIIYTHDFKLSAVMSLIENVSVPAQLRPGFKTEIHGEIISTSERDSLGTAKAFIDGQLVASLGRIIYVHAPGADSEKLKGFFRYYSGWKDCTPGEKG
jgi:3-hydroxyacyl-[acyl-carrier-protein] dehydratase